MVGHYYTIPKPKVVWLKLSSTRKWLLSTTELNLGHGTKAKNIKADSPKILRPTCFSGMEDIKANTFSCLKDIRANSFFLGSNAKNIDKY